MSQGEARKAFCPVSELRYSRHGELAEPQLHCRWMPEEEVLEQLRVIRDGASDFLRPRLAQEVHQTPEKGIPACRSGIRIGIRRSSSSIQELQRQKQQQ